MTESKTLWKPEPPRPEFTHRLRRACEVKEMTQAQVARKSGLEESALSHFATGRRKPSFDNLRKLADALDVSADYLLGRVDNLSESAICVRCGGPAAEARKGHADPTCYGCLPGPAPTPDTVEPGKRPTIDDLEDILNGNAHVPMEILPSGEIRAKRAEVRDPIWEAAYAAAYVGLTFKQPLGTGSFPPRLAEAAAATADEALAHVPRPSAPAEVQATVDTQDRLRQLEALAERVLSVSNSHEDGCVCGCASLDAALVRAGYAPRRAPAPGHY